jgi:hypothetical protein
MMAPHSLHLSSLEHFAQTFSCTHATHIL